MIQPLNHDYSPEHKGKIVEPGGGMKFDNGKPQWSLLMHGCRDGLAGVVAVLGMGAKKYAANSWQKLENAEQRYTDAMYRHLHSIAEHGLLHKDEESGLLSVYHVCCDALFLACFATWKAKAQAEKETH